MHHPFPRVTGILSLCNVGTATFCAGNHVLIAYIFLSAEFYTFHVDYLDIYIINLGYNDNLTVFYKPIYLYIYIMSTFRGHPVTGQRTLRLF